MLLLLSLLLSLSSSSLLSPSPSPSSSPSSSSLLLFLLFLLFLKDPTSKGEIHPNWCCKWRVPVKMGTLQKSSHSKMSQNLVEKTRLARFPMCSTTPQLHQGKRRKSESVVTRPRTLQLNQSVVSPSMNTVFVYEAHALKRAPVVTRTSKPMSTTPCVAQATDEAKGIHHTRASASVSNRIHHGCHRASVIKYTDEAESFIGHISPSVVNRFTIEPSTTHRPRIKPKELHRNRSSQAWHFTGVT